MDEKHNKGCGDHSSIVEHGRVDLMTQITVLAHKTHKTVQYEKSKHNIKININMILFIHGFMKLYFLFEL